MQNVGVKCGKDAEEVCGTAEERATNGVKDVVKMVAVPREKLNLGLKE